MFTPLRSYLTLLLFSPAFLYSQTLVTTIPGTLQPPVTNPTKMVLNGGTNKLYVAGDLGRIAVLDAATNKRIATITMPTADPVQQIFTNDTKMRIYAQSVTALAVIDSTTDTISQSLTIPGTTFSASAYLPGTDRFYDLQTNSTLPLALVARDGTTLASLGTLASGQNSASGSTEQVPYVIVANPGANQLWGFWSVPQSTWIWVWDSVTNTLIDETNCGGTLCNKIILGAISGAIPNPQDNSMWAYAITQPSTAGGGGDEAGSGPIPFPLLTSMLRLTTPLPAFIGNFTFWGGMVPTNFDSTGKIVGFAQCVPSTKTAVASTSPCAGTVSGLYEVDSTTPVGTQAQAVDLTTFSGSPVNSATWSCGANPMGFDSDTNYAYWNCNGSGNGPAGNVGIVKYNLAQPPDTTFFPPRILGQWMTEMPTRTSAANMPFNTVTINRSSHQAFFADAPDSSVIAVDPVAATLKTELLSSRPASITVNPSLSTAYVMEDSAAQVTTINTASNTISSFHVPVGVGSFLAVNRATNQVAVAGVSDQLVDPAHSRGALLLDPTLSLSQPLNASAVGGILFSPSTYTGQGVAIDPATNRGYFLNQMQWYVVDLATGNRIFTGNDLSGGVVANVCEFSGMAVNSAANRYYLIGQCPASVNGSYTLGVFDATTNAPISSTLLANFTNGLGGGYGRMAVNPNTNRLYIELTTTTASAAGPQSTNMIVTYDGATLTRIGTPITSNGGAVLVSFPLAIDTVSNRMFATLGTGAGQSLAMFDASVDAFGRTDVWIGSVATQVRAIGVNEATGTIYVSSAPDINVFQQPPLAPKFTLSGAITRNGLAAAGIQVSISATGGGKVLITDANGAYSLSGLPAGNYTVTPLTPGLFYTPASQIITITTANFPGVNFTAQPAFHVSGRVVDANGNGIANESVGNNQTGYAITDASGAFNLFPVIPGTYSLTVSLNSGVCCFLDAPVTVSNADISGLVFNQLPRVVIRSLTLDPSLIGAGVTSTATVNLATPAPPGGIVVQLQSGGSKAVKMPATVTVAAGTTSATFSVQGSSQGSATLTAVYFGQFSPDASTFANASITVAATDSLKVTSATWSKSTQLLTVNATSTNPQSTLKVFLAANGQLLGTMATQGNGTYTLQVPFNTGTPASINVKSNLGGSTGQGVTVIP